MCVNLWPEVNGPLGPATDRSELVRDFQNFVAPGPIQSEIFNLVDSDRILYIVYIESCFQNKTELN